jgi:hypothetical protein
MSVSCECCLRGLCDKPIFRPEESYRVVCVCVSLIICKSNLSATGRSLVQRSHTEWCVCELLIICKSNLSATGRFLVQRSSTDCGVCV